MEPEEMGGDGDSTSMYGTLAAFEMDKKIGKGQFSEVYRVVCKATGKVLALKKVQVCSAVCTENNEILRGMDTPGP